MTKYEELKKQYEVLMSHVHSAQVVCENYASQKAVSANMNGKVIPDRSNPIDVTSWYISNNASSAYGHLSLKNLLPEERNLLLVILENYRDRMVTEAEELKEKLDAVETLLSD